MVLKYNVFSFGSAGCTDMRVDVYPTLRKSEKLQSLVEYSSSLKEEVN